MLLSGRLTFPVGHARPATQGLPRRQDNIDASRSPPRTVTCQSSQGWYMGEQVLPVQSKAQTGSLKAPSDGRQRWRDEDRRDSGSQASTSKRQPTQQNKFRFDDKSQLGSPQSYARPTRGIPAAWNSDPRNLELLDPDRQHPPSNLPGSPSADPSEDHNYNPASHHGSHQIVELASKIFNCLLQVSDLSSDTKLAKLAADIVAFLPPPGEARSAEQEQDLDSQLERIIAQASAPDGGLPETHLSQQDLAELMLELRKLGGSRVALAVCDIIDGADQGYATRSNQVFNSLLCHCDPSLDPGIIQEVLDRMDAVGLMRDTATFNYSMLAYAKADMFVEAQQLFQEMNEHGLQANSLSYRIQIYIASQTPSWPHALTLYRDMRAKHIPRDEFIYDHLLEACRTANQTDVMMECTDWLRDEQIPCGAHLYIPLMKSCVDTGRPDTQAKFLAVMKDLLGPMPNWILSPFLTHCISNERAENGIALLQDLQDEGLGQLLGTGAAPRWAQEKLKGLYRGLCILASMANDGEFAWQTFEAMQQDRVPLTVELGNKILLQVAATGNWQRSLAVFQSLSSREVPDTYTYLEFMRVMGEAGQFELALAEMKKMHTMTQQEDFHQFGDSQLAVIAGHMGRFDVAWQVLEVAEAHGSKPSVVTINAVMGAALRCTSMSGKEMLEMGLKIVDKLNQTGNQADETTAVTLLSMCSVASDAENAERAWEWCSKLPGQPSLQLYNSMIDTMEKTAQYDRAVQLFEQMRAQGIQGDMKTYGAMVDIYAGRGDWKKQKIAFKVQEWMEEQGTPAEALTYPDLIAKAKDGGNWKRALDLWDDAQAQQAAMHQAALKPSDRTYAVVIKACGKLGLWQKALELKNQITHRRPSRVVYNSVLMTLNICNQLDPALEIRAEMEATGINLDGFSYYTLLHNVCNNGNDWKMALRLFGEMRHKGHQPQPSTCTVLLKCLAEHRQATHALQVFRFITTNATAAGFRPNMPSHEHLYIALAQASQWAAALGVYEYQRRMYNFARGPFYVSKTTIHDELRLKWLSKCMAAVVFRAYLQCLSSRQEWQTAEGIDLQAHHTINIVLGGPDYQFMLQSQVDPASPQELADMIQDYLTWPGCEVAFDCIKEGPDDKVVFRIARADMEKWLQTLDVADPHHAPLFMPNEPTYTDS